VHHPTFINTIDTLITPLRTSFRPEILVGGMIVSKRIKAFTYKPKHHWHIDFAGI
jgi:2-succinyl-5-enolpyruvyl-6-hydroxy-3-cyclohexene-1-carboxylate synthase